MSTILVTGGAGFIGSALVRQLLAETSDTAVTLDKLTYAGNLESLALVEDNPRHLFVHGDIGDRPLVRRLLGAHRPAAIVNVAAESHVDRSIDDASLCVATNVAGTVALLDAALDYWRSLAVAERAAFRFVQVSTDEVYGALGPTGEFCENSRFAPTSPYAASKAAGDHFAAAYFRTFGLPTVVTHASNNYGPFQFPEKLVPLVILNAIDRRPLPVYGDGQQVRDWLHVDDHARALRRVLTAGRPGESYNVGGGAERTNLSVVTQIAALVDRLQPDGRAPRSQLIELVADRPGHDRRYALCCDKIERELGWRPAIGFDDGLAATVAWYLENRAWAERIEAGQYRRQRLGLARS